VIEVRPQYTPTSAPAPDSTERRATFIIRWGAWVGRVFFARFDPHAVWLDDLRPAFGESEFFFEPGLRAMANA